jgi:hypothetical protein
MLKQREARRRVPAAQVHPVAFEFLRQHVEAPQLFRVELSAGTTVAARRKARRDFMG